MGNKLIKNILKYFRLLTVKKNPTVEAL